MRRKNEAQNQAKNIKINSTENGPQIRNNLEELTDQIKDQIKRVDTILENTDNHIRNFKKELAEIQNRSKIRQNPYVLEKNIQTSLEELFEYFPDLIPVEAKSEISYYRYFVVYFYYFYEIRGKNIPETKDIDVEGVSYCAKVLTENKVSVDTKIEFSGMPAEIDEIFYKQGLIEYQKYIQSLNKLLVDNNIMSVNT